MSTRRVDDRAVDQATRRADAVHGGHRAVQRLLVVGPLLGAEARRFARVPAGVRHHGQHLEVGAELPGEPGTRRQRGLSVGGVEVRHRDPAEAGVLPLGVVAGHDRDRARRPVQEPFGRGAGVGTPQAAGTTGAQHQHAVTGLDQVAEPVGGRAGVDRPVLRGVAEQPAGLGEERLGLLALVGVPLGVGASRAERRLAGVDGDDDRRGARRRIPSDGRRRARQRPSGRRRTRRSGGRRPSHFALPGEVSRSRRRELR